MKLYIYVISNIIVIKMYKEGYFLCNINKYGNNQSYFSIKIK